jgi:hypothetical protein
MASALGGDECLAQPNSIPEQRVGADDGRPHGSDASAMIMGSDQTEGGRDGRGSMEGVHGVLACRGGSEAGAAPSSVHGACKSSDAPDQGRGDPGASARVVRMRSHAELQASAPAAPAGAGPHQERGAPSKREPDKGVLQSGAPGDGDAQPEARKEPPVGGADQGCIIRHQTPYDIRSSHGDLTGISSPSPLRAPYDPYDIRHTPYGARHIAYGATQVRTCWGSWTAMAQQGL